MKKKYSPITRQFDFNKNIIPKIIEEIRKAEEYIRIAIFQLHSEEVFDILNKKLSEKVKVEVITLPYDSINEDVRIEVEKRFKNLIKNGAKVMFNKWNIGEPERTATVVGRWYLFHGKFIITDKCAIILSANFTNSSELDAMLVYYDEKKVEEFNKKFDELLELFITPYNGFDGKIRSKIIGSGNSQANNDIFIIPRGVQPGLYDRNWILQYPPEICPENVSINERLYITPFDCRGRNFIQDIIKAAQKYVYISTETFTDEEFPLFIEKIKLEGIEIKILTGYTSMDYTERVQETIKNLIAAGIDVRATEEDLHAKLIITDKHVVIDSVNLNKMNLGFKKTGNFWRENTETIDVCSDISILEDAKHKYNIIFDKSRDIIDKIKEKNINVAGKILKKIFEVRSNDDAKLFLSGLLIKSDVKNRIYIFNIIKEAIRLSQQNGERTITKEHLEEAVRRSAKAS